MAGGHVGRIDRDERPATALNKVNERGLAEQVIVEYFSHQVRAAEAGRRQPGPVRRTEDATHQVTLKILTEEPTLEVLEYLVAHQRVVGGRCAASRHGGDCIELIDQAGAPPFSLYLELRQLLQDGVCQRRGTHPSAGKRRHDHQAVAVVDRLSRAEAISRGRINRIDRTWARRHDGAASDQSEEN